MREFTSLTRVTIDNIYTVGTVLRSFYLKYVLSFFGNVNELFKKFITVHGIGPFYLQENGIIPVEYEGRRSEDIQVIYGVKVVFCKPVEDSRIIEINQKPVHVYSGFFRNIFQDIRIRNIEMVPVKNM